jgi:hypothetical protein
MESVETIGVLLFPPLRNKRMKNTLKIYATPLFILITLCMAMFTYMPVCGSGFAALNVVSTESTASSSDPSLAVGPDGTAHIAWYDYTDYGSSGSDSDIFYKKRTSSGAWSTTEVVSTESTGSSTAPSLAVGPDGTAHIAWTDSTDYGGSGSDSDIFFKIYDANPPVTEDNYDDHWHNSDFTIALTATDDLTGVSYTYYRINNGATRSIDANGPPLITTEGADNKLEYWSIDDVQNEETHKTITGIKLDRTQPHYYHPFCNPKSGSNGLDIWRCLHVSI